MGSWKHLASLNLANPMISHRSDLCAGRSSGPLASPSPSAEAARTATNTGREPLHRYRLGRGAGRARRVGTRLMPHVWTRQATRERHTQLIFQKQIYITRNQFILSKCFKQEDYYLNYKYLFKIQKIFKHKSMYSNNKSRSGLNVAIVRVLLHDCPSSRAGMKVASSRSGLNVDNIGFRCIKARSTATTQCILILIDNLSLVPHRPDHNVHQEPMRRVTPWQHPYSVYKSWR